MKTSHHGQMSESFLTAVFLSLSGGLQDAYTYLFRGKVFANAQTGNIVLLSANLMDGNWERVLHYLVPLCAFALGVLTAEKMRERFREMRTLHWRQLVVLGEGLLLFLVGFLPQEQNLLANAIVSFACAMQVQAFRKVDGYAFASTMCIGDLRSGVEALCIWRKTHEPQARDRMLRYFGIILLFAIGAGIVVTGAVGVARLRIDARKRDGQHVVILDHRLVTAVPVPVFPHQRLAVASVVAAAEKPQGEGVAVLILRFVMVIDVVVHVVNPFEGLHEGVVGDRIGSGFTRFGRHHDVAGTRAQIDRRAGLNRGLRIVLQGDFFDFDFSHVGYSARDQLETDRTGFVVAPVVGNDRFPDLALHAKAQRRTFA